MIEDQIFGAVKKYEDVEEKGSDEEEGMEELEKNQADTEKNIADLLEDDEDLMTEPKIIASQPPSSNLSQLLKGESGKKNHVDDSSDDDFMFRPVVQQQKKNKKQKKQKGQVLSLEEFHRSASQPRETDSGSVADSESEKVSDQEGLSANQGTSKDGWSFEVDEEDVNKLLETETEGVSVGQGSEERTDLEDVFRFDSEMHEDEEEEEAGQVGEQQRKKSVSVDDLNDALMEETTDESEAEGASVPIPNKEDPAPESSSNAEPAKPILGTSMSSSYASSMDSESSTTNSPNPRSSQSKNKNKKGKKKKK